MSERRSMKTVAVRLVTYGIGAQVLCAAITVVQGAMSEGGGGGPDPIVALIGLFGNAMMWIGVLLPLIYNQMRSRSVADDETLVWQQLGNLLEMGTSLPEALGALASSWEASLSTRYSPIAGGLRTLEQRVRAGASLTEAVRASKCFSPCWPPLLAAAESSGELPQLLRESQTLTVGTPWISQWALFFAAVVLSLLCGIGAFLSTYIIPSFVTLAENTGQDKQAAFRASVFYLSIFKKSFLLSGAFPLLFLAIVWAISWRPDLVDRFVTATLSRLPFFRALARAQEQATLLALLAMAMRTHLSTVEAIQLAGKASHDENVILASTHWESSSLSQFFAQFPQIFDRTLPWLAEEGERYGNLPEALAAAAEAARDQAEAVRARSATVMETFVVVSLGVAVALAVISTYIPLLTMVGHLVDELVVP